MKRTSFDILSSDNRAYTDYPYDDGTVKDMLDFGFAFVEQQDHMVEYVVVGPLMAKRIIREVSDVEMNAPKGECIGSLWTAKLMISPKVRDNKIVFSNGGSTAVLHLSVPHMRYKSG